jgi:two-component system nitrate/nitrite response regulator NarL
MRSRRISEESSVPFPSAPKRITVAIVDDHPFVREGLARVVGEQDDFELIGVAATAEDCRTLIEAAAPRVLIADINLGEESIFATLEMFCKVGRSRHREMEVVLLTAFPTRANLVRARHTGVKGVVSKTEDVQRVLDAVRVVAHGELFFPDIPDIGATKDAGLLLSRREREILTYIGLGESRLTTAHRLHISVRTVDRHRQSIMDKLGIHREAELVRFAMTEGYSASAPLSN